MLALHWNFLFYGSHCYCSWMSPSPLALCLLSLPFCESLARDALPLTAIPSPGWLRQDWAWMRPAVARRDRSPDRETDEWDIFKSFLIINKDLDCGICDDQFEFEANGVQPELTKSRAPSLLLRHGEVVLGTSYLQCGRFVQRPAVQRPGSAPGK
ncbi:hypothetical protein VTN77DRAFT_2761 [Rasamsonia byssochlamydoides]|uniref:uncharacterized protein n=1 Tax=Rasamsonia byssochlamydoides TaxID=89139 RepID=UPI0037427663